MEDQDDASRLPAGSWKPAITCTRARTGLAGGVGPGAPAERWWAGGRPLLTDRLAVRELRPGRAVAGVGGRRRSIPFFSDTRYLWRVARLGKRRSIPRAKLRGPARVT